MVVCEGWTANARGSEPTVHSHGGRGRAAAGQSTFEDRGSSAKANASELEIRADSERHGVEILAGKIYRQRDIAVRRLAHLVALEPDNGPDNRQNVRWKRLGKLCRDRENKR